MRKLPMVMVEWEDTCSSGNWSSDEEAHIRTLVIKSVGFLLKDTEDLVSICQSQDDVEKTAERLTIPRVVVKKITYLRVK